MIPRKIESKLLKFIEKKEKHKNVLLVEGVRQTGKSTAIQMALQQADLPFLEINLETDKLFCKELDQTEDFHQFQTLLKRSYNFTPSSGMILYIDEANESQRLGQYVRQMKEDW